MKGFDPKFKDLPDYILGITQEIWENRGIHTLNQYYGKDICLRMPLGVYHGNQGVISKTQSTLVEFPDRELLGEDVIWSGNEDDGFLSSHRLYCTGTHSGPSMFGSPTGKPVVFRVIADCYAINNQITDEWLVRDYGAVAKQLGTDARNIAQALIQSEGGPEHALPTLTPANDPTGPYQGKGNDNEWGETYADYLTRLMRAEFSLIPLRYDRAVHAEYPGQISAHGWKAVDAFWLGLRASFPNAVFSIEHQIGRDDAQSPPRAALRWSLHGKHEGWGHFGKPSGADVYILGISHAEFGPRGLRREYTVFDEVAIWKQILLQQMD